MVLGTFLNSEKHNRIDVETMETRYVILYIRQYNEKYKALNLKIIDEFRKLNIEFKIIDLSEKFTLYGNEISYEGAFALDFSGSKSVIVPHPPLVVAGERIFNGSEEIRNNLPYLQENYSKS